MAYGDCNKAQAIDTRTEQTNHLQEVSSNSFYLSIDLQALWRLHGQARRSSVRIEHGRGQAGYWRGDAADRFDRGLRDFPHHLMICKLRI